MWEAGREGKHHRRHRLMKLSDIFEAGGVVVRPGWGSFEDGIRGLVERLTVGGQVDSLLAEAAINAICEREGQESTAIVEIGVSVPHARLEGVRGLVASLATSQEPLYYETAGVPIRLMVLVLSAPEMAAQHLGFLSKISMLLQSEDVRRRLYEATDEPAVLAFLRENEGA